MFCTRCGHDVASGTKFCPSCGSPVDMPAPPAAAPQPPIAAQQPAAPQYAPPAYGAPPPAYGAPPPAYGAPPPAYGAPPPAYGAVPPAYGAPPAYGYAAAAPQWAPAAPSAIYAGFWRRVLAHIIDGFLLGIVFVLLMVVLGAIGLTARLGGSDEMALAGLFAMLPILMLFFAVGGWLYFAIQESGSRQGTLGKSAIGIKVTDAAGNRLSFGHATGRFFAKFITGLIPFGVGYMLAGWTARKQALHDMIAGTLVVCR
jgi:uncharacterized RDD family membrane protein YckC